MDYVFHEHPVYVEEPWSDVVRILVLLVLFVLLVEVVVMWVKSWNMVVTTFNMIQYIVLSYIFILFSILCVT